jgi:hypothetical protein
MEPAQLQAFSEPLLAAMPQLKEKPCLGVPSKNPALHPGHSVCQSTTALGVSWSVASGTRQSDMIARFLSPDWSDAAVPIPYANVYHPQTFNLYIYGGNNPLSAFDPDGHNWFTDFAQGLADSTYRPIVHIVEHPIATAEGIGTAAVHPIVTGEAIGSAVKSTVVAAAHGDGRAIGQIVGTVGTAVVGGAVAKGIGTAGEIGGEVSSFVGETSTVTSTWELNMSLASEEQMGTLAAGEGEPIIGAGTGKTLNDAQRLASQYGGDPGDWTKVTSGHYSPPGSEGATNGFETHAYQNSKTGQVVEMKSKPDHLQ